MNNPIPDKLSTICDPLFQKARNATHCQSPLRRRSGHSPCDEAIEQHRIKGEPIAQSENGKVKIVNPEEIIPLSEKLRLREAKGQARA